MYKHSSTASTQRPLRHPHSSLRGRARKEQMPPKEPPKQMLKVQRSANDWICRPSSRWLMLLLRSWRQGWVKPYWSAVLRTQSMPPHIFYLCFHVKLKHVTSSSKIQLILNNSIAPEEITTGGLLLYLKSIQLQDKWTSEEPRLNMIGITD